MKITSRFITQKHHKRGVLEQSDDDFAKNTIKCQKLATIASGTKKKIKITWPFIRWEQVSTRATIYRCCTLLLYCGTRSYLLSPDEESYDVFSARNNCCEFLASDGVILQSDDQSYHLTYLVSQNDENKYCQKIYP